jgi:TonB family protein
MSSAAAIASVAFLSVLATAVPGRSAEQASSFVRVYPSRAPGVVAPSALTQSQPLYTAAAMRAKVQGTVSMDVTVDADGRVRDVMVTESLDPDLDASAVAAVSQWVFRPGTLDGVAVPVRVHVGMSFSIH